MTAEDILKNMDAGVDIHGNEVNIFGYAFEPRRVKSGLTNKEVAYLMEHGDLFPGFEVVGKKASAITTRTVSPFS